jgi:CheY-like chemotaxis protein
MGFCVLIVDDSPYNLFVLEEMLYEFKNIAEIKRSMNGEEAIDQIL